MHMHQRCGASGRRDTLRLGEGDRCQLTDEVAPSPIVSGSRFCRDTGTRLTFFVNGANASWSENAPALRPMVDSGQIQMANHTWSHPYLNRISMNAVHDQIQRNADFLRSTYGTEWHAVLRPPYGRAYPRHRPGMHRISATRP